MGESIEDMMKRVAESERKQELLMQLLSKMARGQTAEDPAIASAIKEFNAFMAELKKKYGVQLCINPTLEFRRVSELSQFSNLQPSATDLKQLLSENIVDAEQVSPEKK